MFAEVRDEEPDIFYIVQDTERYLGSMRDSVASRYLSIEPTKRNSLVKGSELESVCKRKGPIDILLLHHRIRRDRFQAGDEIAERRADDAGIGILDLLGETGRNGGAELVDLDDVGHQLDLRAEIHGIGEADHGHG